MQPHETIETVYTMTAKHIGVNVSDLIEQHSIKFQGYRCDKIYRAKLVHAKRICIILLD